MEDERREFLPPEPAGPEPELGESPAPPAPPQPQAPAQPQAPPGYGAAPPGYGAPPPPGYGQPPPPGHAQPPPPGTWQPPPPGWGYAPQPAQPDNGPAVAGFVLSLIAGGLLFLSAGLSTLISVGCAISGIVYSRKGKKKVETGETTKNAGLAQAGFIVGIISLVLAVLATLFWILILVAALTDDEFRDDLEREFDSDSITALLRIAAAARIVILAGPWPTPT